MSRHQGDPVLTIDGLCPPGVMRAYFTGSRVYGNPKPDSDLDLVVLMDHDQFHLFVECSDTSVDTDQYEEKPKSASLKFGKLNVIAVTEEAEFVAWCNGTKKCIDLFFERREADLGAATPVSREEAKAIMKQAYDAVGLKKLELSGDHEV